MSFTARERTARRQHQCFTCGGGIERGQRYYSYTVFPGDEYIIVDHPSRFAECSGCVLDRAAKRLARHSDGAA